MRKLIVFLLVGIGSLAIIGTVVFWLVLEGFDGGESINDVSELPSPNGAVVAFTYASMGGGAAGYCNKIIAVARKTENMSIEAIHKKTMDHLFRGSCSARVVATWLSDSLLQIEFSGPATASGLSIYMSQSARSAPVQARFVMVQ